LDDRRSRTFQAAAEKSALSQSSPKPRIINDLARASVLHLAVQESPLRTAAAIIADRWHVTGA
jgi:hypothetical protein